MAPNARVAASLINCTGVDTPPTTSDLWCATPQDRPSCGPRPLGDDHRHRARAHHERRLRARPQPNTLPSLHQRRPRPAPRGVCTVDKNDARRSLPAPARGPCESLPSCSVPLPPRAHRPSSSARRESPRPTSARARRPHGRGRASARFAERSGISAPSSDRTSTRSRVCRRGRQPRAAATRVDADPRDSLTATDRAPPLSRSTRGNLRPPNAA